MNVLICLSVIFLYVASGSALPTEISTVENTESATAINAESTSSIAPDSTVSPLPEDASALAITDGTTEENEEKKTDFNFTKTRIIHKNGNDYKVYVTSKKESGKDTIAGLPFKVDTITSNLTIHPLKENGTEISEDDTSKDFNAFIKLFQMELETSEDGDDNAATSSESEGSSESCSDDEDNNVDSSSGPDDDTKSENCLSNKDNTKELIDTRHNHHKGTGDKDRNFIPRPYMFPPPLSSMDRYYYPFSYFPFQYLPPGFRPYPLPKHPFQWREI